MYQIRSESVKTFIEDSIELPRFQRKPTWRSEQNFRLALSVFKGYPIGAVVVKLDGGSTDPASLSKFLLDGRQRRDALSDMVNPEEIYDWARTVLRIKAKSSPEEIAEAYWNYVDDYFGRDVEELLGEADAEDWATPAQAHSDEPEIDEPTDDEVDAEMLASIDLLPEVPTEMTIHDPEGLKSLLHTILLVHPRRASGTGMTVAFDFTKLVSDLEFYEQDSASGKVRVSSQKLLTWLKFKRSMAQVVKEAYPPSQEAFYTWITEKSQPSSEQKLRARIDSNWHHIVETMEVLESLERRFTDTKLGYLEISNCSAADEMKIFEIINSAGTQLTSAEILSAKATWNVPVDNPHQSIVESKNALYESLEIPTPPDVRRWDIAASLLGRIDVPWVFGGLPPGSRGFEKQTKLSFQLMSAYYQGRLMKDDLEDLATCPTVPWGTVSLETSIDAVNMALSGINVVKFWRTWNRSIMTVLSDAIALNFLVLLVKDWERKDKPTGGVAFKQVQRNAITLLDRLVFEYVTGQWRGSSDSRIASNITALSSTPDVWSPVPPEDWSRLIEGVVDESQINGQPLLSDKIDGRIKVMLQYYYVIRGIAGPNLPKFSLDWDHIIPQAAFATHPELGAKYLNHITNLALLPSTDNRSKKDLRLNEINDVWLIDQIGKYEELLPAEFVQFSSPQAAMELSLKRGGLIKKAFSGPRQQMLESLQPELAG